MSEMYSFVKDLRFISDKVTIFGEMIDYMESHYQDL